MTAAELPAPQAPRSSLPAPEHPELPADVRQAFVEVDRKCGVFIFPQLEQLGAIDAKEQLVTAARELAEAASSGAHQDLAARYRALLGQAQAALRQARTVEVSQESGLRSRRQAEAQLAATLLAARDQLPQARLVRLQQRISELPDDDGGAGKVAMVEAAVAEWARASHTRQVREAERLADRAHLPIQPRRRETSRSRKAIRDQARVVELAKAFSLDDIGAGPQPGAGDTNQ